MYVRYVVHSLVPVYEKKGWKVLSSMGDTHHGRYSVIMGKEELDDDKSLETQTSIKE